MPVCTFRTCDQAVLPFSGYRLCIDSSSVFAKRSIGIVVVRQFRKVRLLGFAFSIVSLSPGGRTERCFAVMRSHVSANTLNPMILQQIDAPPHLASTVRQDLGMKLSNRWTEKKRPISRPARPPDLTPRNFLGVYVKTEKLFERPAAIAEIKANLYELMSGIEKNTLQNVFQKNQK